MKPLILITNDDSINAKGLHVLIDTVKEMGEVYVVAPAEPHSGQSSAFTVNSPIRINEHEQSHGARVFSITGTPVDCVKLAMHHIVPRKPNLLLSESTTAPMPVTPSFTPAPWEQPSRHACSAFRP